MADPLGAPERLALCNELKNTSRDPLILSSTIEELLPLVAGVDDWVVSVAGDFNQAIPQPFRGELSAQEKNRLFAGILDKRWFVGAAGNAVLDASDRRAICEAIHEGSKNQILKQATLTQLTPLIAGVDDWAVSVAASFNQAIPQPFRSNLTAAEKARTLAAVLYKRWVVGV